MLSYDYDLAAIGSGPAGQRAAVQAAKLGKRAAVIEKQQCLGGVCLGTGTIPSKTLREAVLFFSRIAARHERARVTPPEARPTAEQLLAKVDEVLAREQDVIEDQLRRNDVAIIRGEASFIDPHTLLVRADDGWPHLQPPRLELDPRLLLFARNMKFELEAGQESSFKTNLGSGTTEREVTLVGDLKATVWSKPVGKNVEFASGGGMIEKRLKPDPQTETSVYVFAKADVKDILKLGPLDLAKLEAEAQLAVKLDSQEPPDLSVSVGVGPEVEALAAR